VAAVTCIDYAPTGLEFVTGSYDKTIRIFESHQVFIYLFDSHYLFKNNNFVFVKKFRDIREKSIILNVCNI